MLKTYLTRQEAQEAIDNLPDAYHRSILHVLKVKDICKVGKDGYVVQLKPFKGNH